jgi:hypothetical protein
MIDGWCLDLLHALEDVESDHRIRAVVAVRFQPALGGTRRHTGETLVSSPSEGCGPANEAVRKSPIFVMTRERGSLEPPHRIPCHCRVTHRWFTTPRDSGTASHRIRRVHVDGGATSSLCRDKATECRLTAV